MNEIKKIIEDLRNSNKKIAFTNGCFDILHLGHLNYLKEAKSLADILIVGLNSDSSIKKIKGENRPINNENDRKAMLSALRFVDYVFIFEEETPYELIKIIKPDILVKGGDWAVEKIVGSDFVLQNKGEVKKLLFEDGYSTTNIINKILKAYK